MPTAELTIELPVEEVDFLKLYAKEHGTTVAALLKRYAQALRNAPRRLPHPATVMELPSTVVPNPSEIIFMQESLWLVSFTALRPAVGADFGIGNAAQFTYWHDGRSVNKELYSTLHSQGANLTFVDGHTEYRKAAQLRAKHFGLADGPSGKAEDTQKAESTLIYRSAFAAP